MYSGFFKDCFGDANALYSRAVFETLGGVKTGAGSTGEDWEFLSEAMLAGFSLEVMLSLYILNPDL